MPPDPRDAELVEAIVGAVRGMILAVHGNDNLRLMGEMAVLVNAIITHKRALETERPGDEHLRRAVAALNAGGHHSPPHPE